MSPIFFCRITVPLLLHKFWSSVPLGYCQFVVYRVAKMQYCPPNVTFSDIWVDHGVSHCFLDTVTSSTYGLFLLVCGLAQWFMYRRYASLSEGFIRGKSYLLVVQMVLSAFLPLLAVLQLVLLATVIGQKKILLQFQSYDIISNRKINLMGKTNWMKWQLKIWSNVTFYFHRWQDNIWVRVGLLCEQRFGVATVDPSGAAGAPLPAAVGAIQRPRHRAPPLLDLRICGWKPYIYQFEEWRLVVWSF